MSKPKSKSVKSAETATKPLIVLGFDERQRPRGARFTEANPTLVAKAAKLMDLNVYEANSDELVDIAKKLPVGRLYANGRGFIPNIRQTLHSKVIAALAGEPQTDADEPMPAASPGLPASWSEISVGHLVVAQESHENGWWEAIVVDCKGDMLTIRFRDYPKLPKFYRHRTAVALINSGV